MYRKVLEWPNPSLLEKSSLVKKEDSDQVIQDLKDSFRVTGGLGLAAPQIGIRKRAIIVSPQHLNISTDEMLIMINPTLKLGEEIFKSEEACFSIPFVSDFVPRHSQCTVNFYNEEWEEQQLDVAGLASACIQHEVDHLDGILYIKKIGSALKRSFLLKKVKKQRKKIAEQEKEMRIDFERDHEELMSGNFDGQKTSKKTYTRKRKAKPRRKHKRSKKRK